MGMGLCLTRALRAWEPRYNMCSFSCLFCFIFSLVNYNEHAVKGKQKHLVPCGGKGFLVIM